MDPLSQFLTGPRAQAAFALRVVMDAPFAIDVRDEAALTVITPVRGAAWIVPDHAAPQLLGPGQAATVRGPGPYRVADTADRAPTVVIDPGQSCRTPAGEHLETTMAHGLRTWGNSAEGDTVLLIGTYQSEAAVGGLVTSALPPLAVFTEHETDPALRGLLERELTTAGPGQASALDRILDLMLLDVVRAWARRSGPSTPSWITATGDPVVSEALALLHEQPADPWTVAELARRVHVSRATLAARFRTAVGQPPMAYLTTWRLALAADRLVDSTATTATIAAEVGYSSAFTFSTAFTRAYGASPTAYRRTTHSRHPRNPPGIRASTSP
ncbi:AraC family transcriptional regulator [Kocuria arenosa]|uniref:AraC family transcriptional regulator n=1 Tax=Kocuria arenosa TaxID=3071446 RepID=UPI0034D4FD27